MKEVVALSSADRADLFNHVGAALGLPPFYVEKDFWVCWTLDLLFGRSGIAECWYAPHVRVVGWDLKTDRQGRRSHGSDALLEETGRDAGPTGANARCVGHLRGEEDGRYGRRVGEVPSRRLLV